jgi:hypothetical protein
MKRVSSIFSQLLQLFPRLEFEAAVTEHQAERHARGDLLPEISTRDNLESSVEKTEGSYQDEEDQVH